MKRFSIDLCPTTIQTDTGKALRTDSTTHCIHCGQPTEFKIWKFDVMDRSGCFVFDCGCKFEAMKERLGI